MYALRGLLGVRYIMMPLDKADAFEEECGQWGYTRAFSDETFAFYKNGNAPAHGFAYDAYVTMEELEKNRGIQARQRAGARCGLSGRTGGKIRRPAAPFDGRRARGQFL